MGEGEGDRRRREWKGEGAIVGDWVTESVCVRQCRVGMVCCCVLFRLLLRDIDLYIYFSTAGSQ